MGWMVRAWQWLRSIARGGRFEDGLDEDGQGDAKRRSAGGQAREDADDRDVVHDEAE